MHIGGESAPLKGLGVLFAGTKDDGGDSQEHEEPHCVQGRSLEGEQVAVPDLLQQEHGLEGGVFLRSNRQDIGAEGKKDEGQGRFVPDEDVRFLPGHLAKADGGVNCIMCCMCFFCVFYVKI